AAGPVGGSASAQRRRQGRCARTYRGAGQEKRRAARDQAPRGGIGGELRGLQRKKGQLMTSSSKHLRKIVMAGLVVIAAALGPTRPAGAGEPVDPAIANRFEYLSTNGNSNCSLAFRDAMSNMPTTARLQGSCCSPMDLARYAKQIDGLKK